MTTRRVSEFPPPAWMPEAGCAEWRRIVPALRGGLASEAFDPILDRRCLEAYCVAVAEVEFWRGQALEYAKPVYRGRPTFASDSTAALIADRTQLAEDRVLRLAERMGLTPASRATIAYRLGANR